MSIREKLLDLKRRLSDRKMYSIVIVIIGAVGIWGVYQYKQAAELRQQLDNQYNRAFYEMTGYVNNVDTLLVKTLITSTPARTAAMLEEVWRQANLAQANLGQLPVSQPILANTSKFLTQVGDLAYSLNQQNLNGKPLSEKQQKTIEQLQTYAVSLSDSLGDFQSNVSAGRIKWGEIEDKGSSLFQRTSAELPKGKFENIDKTFQKYPSLIYDGPFSDHLADTKAEGLTGKNLTQEEAKNKVIAFLGKSKVKSVTDAGKDDNGKGVYKTYSFQVTFQGRPEKETTSISVTQKGGHVLWMINSRPVDKEIIKVAQAKSIGKKFLETQGYKNMVDTYYLKEDHTATINYAYKQDKTTVYPDLIKVKVALDTGEIVGFESKAYLSSHKVRKIPKPKVTLQQARGMISKNMKVMSSGLSIIPTDYKTEIFTYEFKGKLGDKDFLVYINAENGNEENILMIVNTPNGILTM